MARPPRATSDVALALRARRLSRSAAAASRPRGDESAAAAAGGLMPASRSSDSVFGSAKSLLDIPRSVTVLTPELMQKLGVRSFDDVARVIPGGERPNYYGVPGTPFIRGDFAGTFFNGMQRIFQRNEMPTSFGSLDGMDIVRGPAPGNYGPTQGGGYINFLPKSPYYDKFRGSLRTTVGTDDYFNTQLDVGGPLLAFGKPMAFRRSCANVCASSTMASAPICSHPIRRPGCPWTERDWCCAKVTRW
jgi:outer membrane receptor protein involved in Fe transport